jgi:hypothetical protein
MAKLLERFGGANQQSILLQGLSWGEVPERINDVRNVQSSKIVHAALLLLMLEAVFTDLVSPSA